MISWCDLPFTLALASGAEEAAGRVAEGLRGGRAEFDSGTLLTLALSLAAIVLVLWFTSYCSGGRRRTTAYHSPGRLFLTLCRAHRLGWRDVWLLWRLARWYELEDPARLFLEPERFDPSTLSRRLTRQAARLRLLRSRLFAGLVETDSPSGPPANSGAFGLPLPSTATAGIAPPVETVA